jgi:hypothetical protein
MHELSQWQADSLTAPQLFSMWHTLLCSTQDCFPTPAVHGNRERSRPRHGLSLRSILLLLTENFVSPTRPQETAEAIAQLATVTASDRGTVATLTTTNAKLANQLEAAHALIAQLKSEITTLKIKIKPVWQGQRPTRTTNNNRYCWSHGYQVAKSNTSATCNVRKTGHQENTTKINTMGGVQWGKE